MGKIKKSTKKFIKTKLKDTISRRKEAQKIKSRKRSRVDEKAANEAPNLMEADEIKEGDFDDDFADAALNDDSDPPEDSSDEDIEDVDIEDGDDEPAASEPEDEENDEIDESDVDTVANHKEQLEKLKRQDPEFYKYLEENDKQLLDFGESDEDGDDNEEGDGEEAEEQAGDEGDEEMDESIVITAETIQTWKSQLAKNSLAAVRKTLLGFRAACAMGDVDGDDNHAFSYKIEDSAVYSSMVVTCIKYVPNVIKNHLIPKSEEGKENVSVSKSPKWKKLKPFVKSYASNLVRLLKQMTDVAMVRFVVRESENAISFFTAFPKLGKEYLKLLAKLWADANEKIKVVAFLCIRKLAVSNPQPYLELSLKGTYLHYMEAARMTNRVTWNNLAFMSSCITELASLHPPTTYQLVFLYIRQLAMLLRSALMSATKESFKKVVNWQFVRCISVWSKTLGSLCHTERAKDETAEMLRPLIYPLVQIGLGSMRIKPSAKFFAFRFHITSSLTELMRSTGTLIPLGPFLFEIFDSHELRSKGSPSTLKPPQFSTSIKVPNAYLGTRTYQIALVEETLHLLYEYHDALATSISFPEFSIPAIVKLKHFAKKSGNPQISKPVQQLVDKLSQNSKWVEQKRSNVDFSPKDEDKVRVFENSLLPTQSPLHQHVVSRRLVRTQQEKVLQESFQAEEKWNALNGRKRAREEDDDNSEEEEEINEEEGEEDESDKGGDMDESSDKMDVEPSEEDEDDLFKGLTVETLDGEDGEDPEAKKQPHSQANGTGREKRQSQKRGQQHSRNASKQQLKKRPAAAGKLGK